jgi:hypothetical protein
MRLAGQPHVQLLAEPRPQLQLWWRTGVEWDKRLSLHWGAHLVSFVPILLLLPC